MAATRLDILGAETLNQKKSGVPTAIGLAADMTSGTSPALATTYAQIGNTDGFDCGNNPIFAGVIVWEKGSGATLTLAFTVSIDGVTFTKMPVFATPSTGASAVSPGSLTYAVSTWDNAVLPLGTRVTTGTNDCAFELRLGAYRYVKVYCKVDDATNGKIKTTSAVWVGTLA